LDQSVKTRLNRVTVLPIIITGHPVLAQPASPVGEVTDTVRQLVSDMAETMHAAPGVGLAAPQVGVSLQLFVWHFEDGDGLHEGHVLNPRLTVTGWPKNLLWGEPAEEGCLSLPGLRAPLARYPWARLRGRDLEGNPVDVSARGWLARIFQHEYDHIRGVLYADRLRRGLRRDILADAKELGLGTDYTEWTPSEDVEESDFWPGDDDTSHED
jgi:peptide deformylase